MNWQLNRSIYFASQKLRNEPVKAALTELKKSLFYSADQLQEIQLKRLQTLLQHAFATVPFYQESFKKYGSEIKNLPLAALPQLMDELPTLNKQEVLKNRQAFYSSLHFAAHQNISSGTTGEPFAYPCDQISWAYRHASIIRCLEYYGVKFGSRYAYFFGQHWKNELRFKTKLKDAFFNRDRFSAFSVSKEQVLNSFLAFKKNGVGYFFGYPSTMVDFCKICVQELHLSPADLHLKMVLTTGETLEDFQKKYLSRVLNCPVINYYGSAEGGAGAFEGKEGLMHENMETTFVQTDDANKIIKTDLFLRQFPLIKIQTDDVCIAPKQHAPTALKHKVLGTISGRTGEKIKLPDGSKMHAIVLDYFFDLFVNDPNVLRFRFQFSKTEVTLLIESPLQQLEDAFIKKITKEFAALFKGWQLKILKVEKIPLLPNGKHKPWTQN